MPERAPTQKLNFKEWVKQITRFACEALNLTESDLEKLGKRIEKSNGIARVFMHPLTIGNDFLGSDKDAIGDHSKIIDVLARCIKQNVEQDTTPPTSCYWKTTRYLKQL